MANLLVNPNAINVSPWSVSGPGSTATSATTVACGSGVTSLAQTVTVAPNTAYTFSCLISQSAAPFSTVGISIYPTNYATVLGGSGNKTTSTSPQTFSGSFNSGSYSAVVFEIDWAANSAGSTQTVTGSSLAAAATVLTLSDTLTLVDSLRRAAAMIRTDAVSMTESLRRSIGKSATDSLTLSDFTYKAAAMIRTDTVSIADTLGRAIRTGLSDALTLTETLGRAVRTGLSDVLTWTDTLALTRAAVLVLADALTLTETLGRAIRTGLSDVLTWTDTLALTRAAVLVLSDAVTLVEALGRSVRITRADALALSDSVTKSIGWVRSEAYNLVDTLGSYLQTLADFSLGAVQRFAVRVIERSFTAVAARRLWRVRRPVRKWLVSKGALMVTTSKDPNGVEDFEFDWTAEIGSGDKIIASAWIPITAGLTIVASSFSDKTTTARIAGGIPDRIYTVRNEATLQSGQIKARSIQLTIETS